MTDEIILHHYFTSPFSEKVRILLGIKGLTWRSVIQPTIMPKPDLTPLTGGYRRIPVMQIGADVFCDSAVIMAEIERRHPTPRVIHGGDWAVNLWADRLLFQPTVGIIFGAIGHTVPEAFIKDREAMSGGRPFDVAAMKAAAGPLMGQFRGMAVWLERQLADGPAWVAGDAPGLADIAWHMNFWFLGSALKTELAGMLADLPNVAAWRERVLALGAGSTRLDMSTAEAIALARAAAPAAADHLVHDLKDPIGLAPGAAAHVVADDYGRDPIAGNLVVANADRIVISRDDPRVGTVHVHFPRVGFTATPA